MTPHSRRYQITRSALPLPHPFPGATRTTLSAGKPRTFAPPSLLLHRLRDTSVTEAVWRAGGRAMHGRAAPEVHNFFFFCCCILVKSYRLKPAYTTTRSTTPQWNVAFPLYLKPTSFQLVSVETYLQAEKHKISIVLCCLVFLCSKNLLTSI